MDEPTPSLEHSVPPWGDDPPKAPVLADRVGLRLKERTIAARLFGTKRDSEPITVARFDVLRRLGEGGMGVVYAAYDATLDREVALKLIRAGPGETRRTEERLAAEARAMARLAHAHVATVFEVGEHEGQVFIAMELVPGVTLREWLARPRKWQEIFEVLVRAGRGLAAAHAAGLVHRDFKPENVMVGPTERGQVSTVKVMDFGLARGATMQSTQREIDGGRSTNTTTQQARWAGTPAYMAPEQMAGGPIDARGDQFSFCVTAYEALCGRRPFLGNDLAELRRAMSLPPPPPSASQAPRRVMEVILRGLSPDPADRFEDMSALLHALQHDRWARVRRTVLGSTAIVLAGLAGFAATWLNRETPCAPPEDRVQALWSEHRQDRIARAFESTGMQHAGRSWDATAVLVEDYVTRWSRAKSDACRATRIESTQSEDALELRTACLERRFADLDRLLELLEEPDAETVGRAPTAVSELRAISDCTDVAALRERRESTAKIDAVQVAELTVVLDRAEALLGLGRAAQAQLESSGVLDRAEAIGDAALLARALHLAGRIEIEFGKEKHGAELLGRAMIEAIAAGDAERLAKTATQRASALSDGGDAYEQALGLLALADGALRRADDPWSLRQAWHDRRAAVFRAQGRFDEAADELGAALRLATDARPPRPHLIARAHSELAYLQLLRGRGDSDIEAFTEVVDTCETELGPTHPECAAMHRILGTVYLSRMRWDDAEREAKLAIERLEMVFGPNYLQLTPALRDLAVVHHRTGRYDEAEVLYMRARDILRVHRGIGSSQEATLEDDLARLYQQLDRLEEAERAATAALEIGRRHHGDANVGVAESLDTLAMIVAQRGDGARARAVVLELFDVLDRSGLSDHPLRSKGLTRMGRIASDEGDLEESLVWFRRAAEHAESIEKSGNDLAVALFFVADVQVRTGLRVEAHATYTRILSILDDMDGSNPMLDGIARFAFAQLLWPEDRAHALAQARRAHASLAPIDRRLADEAQAWIDERDR